MIRYDKAALTSDFAARLLQMSRDVAAGMTYLAGLSFIHRVRILSVFSVLYIYVCCVGLGG